MTTFRVMLTVVALAASGVVLAKLPPLDDAAKAKAAETTAKAAWQAKLDAFQLCKVQDRVAAAYRKTGATAAKAAPAAAAAAQPAPAGASSPGTPAPGVAAAPPPPAPCADPGPFAYAPPEQKPLETSGAHSPAATAASPPSVKPNAADMAPGSGGVPAAPGAKPAAAKKS